MDYTIIKDERSGIGLMWSRYLTVFINELNENFDIRISLGLGALTVDECVDSIIERNKINPLYKCFS